MEAILGLAQQLVSALLSLMPSAYQRENLEAMLGLFLEAQGHPLPQHTQSKSASALSRFLNVYGWSTRKIIHATRSHVLKEILHQPPKGRKPFLQVMIDLTNLEKCGKFKKFKDLITVYNGKRGLHLVVLYLVVGKWRIPWSFRVWRGKNSLTCTVGIETGQVLTQILNQTLEGDDSGRYRIRKRGISSRYTPAQISCNYGCTL